MLKKLKELFSPFHILLCSTTFSALQQSCLFQEFKVSRNCSDLQHPIFSRNPFYPGTALICSIPSFPEIQTIQELLCSTASRIFPEIQTIQELLCSAAFRLFLKSRLSRNCSALEHPVFSRNLDYPETALLCSIPAFPEIQTIQELLCSAASRLFQKSRLSRNCSALHHPVFSRNCSALQHPVFSRNLLYPWKLLCSMHYPIFSRNIFHLGTALLCSIPSITGIYSIQELLCSAASFVFQKHIPLTNCRSALQNPAEIKSMVSSQNSISVEFFPVLKTYTGCFTHLRI